MCGIDFKVASLRQELLTQCRICESLEDHAEAVEVAGEIQLLDKFMQAHYRACAACENKAKAAMEAKLNG